MLYGGFMTSITTRLAAALAALAAAAVLSSCTDRAADDHGDQASTVVAGEPAGFNADDVSFAEDMIPHHQQAVDMSALVPDRSSNPEVIALAETISAAQAPEIQILNTFLVQWKSDDESPDHSGHGDMGMEGMVDQATMTRLASLQGAEFDTLWLQSMIGHHQGAIEMAKAEIANGKNVDAIGLANQIASSQQAEIDQMRQLLGG